MGEKMENIQIKQLREKDIDALIPIMKRAFDEDSMIHLGRKDGPTGYNDGSFLRKYALDKSSDAYTVWKENQIIGAVIVWINKQTNENYLGNIFIDSDVQEQGIGLKVWEMIEQHYPETKIWTTDTPLFSRRNHNFYINKCGFHLTRIKNPKSIDEGMYMLEKWMNR